MRLLKLLMFSALWPSLSPALSLAQPSNTTPSTTQIPAPQTFEFSLAPQALTQALAKFSEITGIDYLAVSSLLEGKVGTEVFGKLTIEQALQKLLTDQHIDFHWNSQGTLILRARAQVATQTQKKPQIEEVIVTAQKRHQVLSEVPVAMSAFSGDTLATINRTHVRNLAEIAPSLSYHGAISSAGQALHIRGIGSGVIATGIEQSVSTIVDGVVTGPSGSGLQELWDIERIEVLRGPQGTLFGKNVSAGAVHFISRPTADTLEAKLTYDHEFELKGQRLDGMVNIPFSQHQSHSQKNIGYHQLRLSGFYFEQDEGSVYNTVADSHENTKQHSGLRLKWDYKQDDFWLNTNISHLEIDDQCCARVFSQVYPEQLSGFSQQYLLPALERNQLAPDDDNLTAVTEGSLYEQSTTLHGVIDTGFSNSYGHTFKSILGWRRWDHQSGRDADNLDIDVVWVKDARELTLSTQEFQWLSPRYENWEHLLGLYFYQQQLPSTEWIGGGTSIFPDSGVTTVDSQIDIHHAALFGHVRWNISKHWSLSGGARWLTEEIRGQGQQSGDNWIWPTDYPKNQISHQDNDGTASLSLQWQPHNNYHFFSTIARGYKGAAIDNTSNAIFYRAPYTNEQGDSIEVVDSILEPEIVLNKELGAKLHLFDRALFISSTLFHSSFKNYQASAYDGNSHSFRLQNAGEVRSQGLELEFSAELSYGFSVDGSLAYIDARFKNFEQVPCQVEQAFNGSCDASVGQDISGKRLNETPQWQSFLLISKQHFTQYGIWTGHINYAWRYEVTFDQDLDPNTEQSAYGLLGASLDLEIGQWSFTVYGDNITDENYAVRIIDSPIWSGSFQRYPGEGRRLGIKMSWSI